MATFYVSFLGWGGKLEAALGENGSEFELRGENSIQLYGRKGEKAIGTIYIHLGFSY